MAAIESMITLKVSSSTENLALIRDFVSRVGGLAGFDEADIAGLELAVDEACTNVIEHAYGYDISKEVIIRAIFDDEKLRIEVIDTGCGFDYSKVQPKELEKLIAERKSGGLGLRLIKSLMDEVHYEIEPGKKNELHMTKRL